jgi:hypothetical protein
MSIITLSHTELPEEMQERRKQTKISALKEQLKQSDLSAKKRTSLQMELRGLIRP